MIDPVDKDDRTASGASTVTDQLNPVIWDEPPEGGHWVLWLIGQDAGDELRVSVELRRGDQRMSITEPILMLGGSQGIVFYDGQAAPLDDCGAYRWATQFRDDAMRHGEPTPIRIPAPDVRRFLDRLYLLPQLPEIDLPPGVGLIEQHVSPIGHVELFSATVEPGNGGDSAALKNQLVCIWFA